MSSELEFPIGKSSNKFYKSCCSLRCREQSHCSLQKVLQYGGLYPFFLQIKFFIVFKRKKKEKPSMEGIYTHRVFGKEEKKRKKPFKPERVDSLQSLKNPPYKEVSQYSVY